MINFRTVFFSVLSVFIYTCVYTPLKKTTPLAVFIGAFPGAIPFMLGWVAATNKFGIEPGILFLIQFILLMISKYYKSNFNLFFLFSCIL